MDKEKILEILKDETFQSGLAKTATAEEAQKLFASKGVDITIDELNAIRAACNKDLSEDELASVAGGGTGGNIGDYVEDLVTKSVPVVLNILEKIAW